MKRPRGGGEAGGTPLAARLAAEFVVIVSGVLLALAADGWVDDREARRAETEYLQRLLTEVRADRGENAFVRDLHLDALAWADSLVAWIESGTLGDRSDDDVATAFLIASEQRQPDYPRTTYRELIASGRIGLIRSPEVQRRLAEYDRLLTEYEGLWAVARGPLQTLRRRVIPPRVLAVSAVSCREDAGTGGCRVEVSGWSADRLRAGLTRDEGVGDLWQSMSYQNATAGVLAEVIDPVAAALESAICAELDERCD